MNEFELSRRLYEKDSKPVFCFTAIQINLKEAQDVMPSLKAKGFFRKPISIHELVTAINGLLDAR
jgi:hypothetical protein